MIYANSKKNPKTFVPSQFHINTDFNKNKKSFLITIYKAIQ